jgi:4-hydroxybenzoate polyprenyltransferase
MVMPPPIAIIQFVTLTFPLSLFIYGINDIYDYESDSINPRKSSWSQLQRKESPLLFKVSIFSGMAVVLVSLFTVNLTNIIGTFLLIFFSFSYSAPPLRFKTRPPLDSLANGFLYFLCPYLIGYSYNAEWADLPWRIIAAAIAATGIHAFSTIMDYTPDKEAGDRTFAVHFGKRMSALYAIIAATIALIFSVQSPATDLYLKFLVILTLPTMITENEKIAKNTLIVMIVSSLYVANAHFPWWVFD